MRKPSMAGPRGGDLYLVVRVECNACPMIDEHTSDSKMSIARRLREQGWTLRRRSWYCPMCSKAAPDGR